MNSRQSHKPRGNKKKGSLRFAEGKRTTTVGQTSRQAKQFASGIMGKYGWDRHNYLGMFALIFKGKGLLTDKELASIKNPSDRAWILQLQLQLQSLKHPESAPLITKQQTIQQIQKLVKQSGYQLPKQAFIDESHQDEKSVSSGQMPSAVDVPVKKKRGRKSKKAKELAAQILAEQEQINAAKRNHTQSKQETINVVNKRNSPIMQRSMRQLVASIGMLAHSTSSKINQPSPMVNGVQHTGQPTNISQKTINLLYKQALRDNKDSGVVRSNEHDGHTTARVNHANVAQHVEAIQSASVWLEQFQAGKLSFGRNDDEAVDVRLTGQNRLQSNPSFFNVAKLILQEVTQTPLSHRGLTQQSSHNMSDSEVPRSSSTDSQTIGFRKSIKLGEGPFSEESSPSTVRFIRSLLSKHAEGQDAQASKRQPAERDQAANAIRTGRSNASNAKGFLSSSLQPMAINASSITSRLPRSMHASASSSSPSRSRNRGIDASTTQIWRKAGDQQETAQSQPSSQVMQEQAALIEVVQKLQQERDELKQQDAVSSQSPVIEQLRIQQEQQEAQLRVQREESQEQQEAQQSRQRVEQEAQQGTQQQAQREELQEQQVMQQRVQREELQEQQAAQQRVQQEELQERQETQQRVQREELQEQQLTQQRTQREELEHQETHQQFAQAQSQISQENEQAANLVHERDRQAFHQRQIRENPQALPELQAAQYNNEHDVQRESQVSLEQEEPRLRQQQQKEQAEHQAKQEQQMQDLGYAEPVVLQPIDQPEKRKRGRPRKNSNVQEASKETTHETIVGFTENLVPPTDVQPIAESTFNSETVGMPEQESLASKQVEVVTAYPSQVYRKPARMENRRSKAQKIQSNESWLQQLVTIQRQPSSNNDTFIRSTNSLNKDRMQDITNRASAQLSLNVVKPDLGTDVLGRSISKFRDQRLRESAIVPKNTSRTFNGELQLGSNRLHRQQENQSVDSRTLPIQRELDISESKLQRAIPEQPKMKGDELLRSATTQGLQDVNTRQEPIKQEDQSHSNKLVVSENRPAGKLTTEIAAKIAAASVRSIGTLLPTPIEQKNIEKREVVRLLRTSLRPSQITNNRMAGQQSPGIREDQAGSVSQRTTIRQTLAAEIAAKVAQSSMIFVNSSQIATDGPKLRQRSFRQPASLVQESRSLFLTETSRENKPYSAKGTSDIQSSVSEHATGKPTNDTTVVGVVQSVSRTPLEMVRRAGRPSRVNQVKEQQASIQRKIDLGEFISRKPTLSSHTQLSSTSSEGDETISRSTGAWARGQLTLRAGRIENGTVTRRASGSDDAQSLDMSRIADPGNVQRLADTDRKDQRQLNFDDSLEPTSEPVAGEVGARTSSVSENISSTNGMLDAHIEEQNFNAAAPIQLNRTDGEIDNQRNQPAREVVRGEFVQRPSFGENSRQSKPNNGMEHPLQARGISNSVLGELVQRALGVTNGIQVRRANQLDNVQSHRTSGELVRSNFVQRSSENEIRQNARQVATRENEGLINRTVGSELSVQRTPGRTTSLSPLKRSVDVTNRQILGQNTMESSKRIPGTGNIGTGNLIQRASETRIRQLINKASSQAIRQGLLQGADGEASPKHGAVNWSGAQAEHLQRRTIVDGSERAPMREARGSENRLEAEGFQVDSAEQTIRAMVSAQVEAQALEPAAASRAAETVSVARAARAPRARQSTSMTPRVMPLLASSAGALRAAPAGMAAASPAAAEHRLPARGTGSLVQAAASGGAAAATAGALSSASITNSSSQGWAAAALTKPLPTQVQRLARPGGGMQADINQGAPAMSALMQSRTQPPSIGASHQGAPAMSAPMQSRTQPPSIGASHQGTPAMSVPMQSRTQPPSIGASHQGTPAMSVPMQSRTQPPSIGASHQGTPAMNVLLQSASQEHLASPLSMLEHKQASSSQLANAPLDMDWLRTKASADSEPTPAAPVDQTPPELSEEQLQELIKQLPQLDIAKIADKVYREIEKKMKFERQRRGI
ncbi:hypothetical protein [Paenibacillus qinlingensis]|uniref:hypothetical protein n=1 Tax=Paenibacillus qinlingensis TaxID=1837343 RepID=UPI001566C847|nr:hypothetical protein [Paenibacillus qinlingensis]NQX61300.1 hypothetical protein [Paenibacillus qinlingensis]